VTNIVNELLEERFVVESEIGHSRGGRKPILLKLNAQAFAIIGIDVGVNTIKSLITDLDAGVIGEHKRNLPPYPDETSFLAELSQCVTELLQAAGGEPAGRSPDGELHGHASRRVIGIGVGMHGLVNPEEGVSVFAPNLNLRNIRIRETLEQQFGLPVYVENDVVAMALAEQWFGGGQQAEHFICVNVGVGVGAGIVLNRQIFHGASYAAGEIGHTTIDLNGPRCSCGSYGCLQTLVSGPAIAHAAQTEIALGRPSSLAQSGAGDLRAITGELVYEAALAGDALAIETFRKAGRLLGISLTNMIHTLNPQKIILGGGVAQAGPLLIEPLLETVKSRALDSSISQLAIETSQLGSRATAIGAVTIVLQQLFAQPHFLERPLG
jgi:glucokinase-like ROK family protein